MTKHELRKLMARRKAGCPPELRRRLSADVSAGVLASRLWAGAQTVLLYCSLPDEADTSLLLAEACRQDKRVLLPVVVGDDLSLRLYQGPASMQAGAFGILEPQGPDFPAEDYAQIDLVVVPGVAFDRAGHRLGRGRGYYDRLLPRLTSARRMGICWDFQLLDCVPCLPHDVVMDCVVSNLPSGNP